MTVENLDRKIKEYIVTRNENEDGIGSRFMSESSSEEDDGSME